MKQWLFWAIFLQLFSGLTAAADLSVKPIRIMSLGDSITVGYTDNPKWQVPFEFGYRSGLFTRLNEAGCDFEFVGKSAEPWDGLWKVPANKPKVDLRSINPDYINQDKHRGYGGKTIVEISEHISQFIGEDRPDVILLLIGINGISPKSPQQLKALVDNIFVSAPEVSLIVAQIPPYATFNQYLLDYNDFIRDTLIPSYVNKGYRVSTVDLYSLFLQDKADPSVLASGLHSNNINHPTNALYDEMAQRWFDELEQKRLVNCSVKTGKKDKH
jgi:lysophospholipase L1-like esterase